MSDISLEGITNFTSKEQESSSPFHISEYVQVMIIVMYTIVILIAIGGNSIVCYLVYAYKRMQTVPNYFIVNLAISDIIMALFCIPFTFIANLILNYWPFGEALCPAVLYIQTVAVFLSSYTLVAMSIDRYIVIVHPFKPRISVRQTVLTILAIWLVSLTIPLPTFIKSRVIYHSNTSGQCREEWGNNTEQYTYGLSLMILHYFAPLVLLLFSYSRIGYTIWRMNINGTDKNKRKLHCYNPMIYLWMSPKFRTGLKMALSNCNLRRKSKTSSDDEIYEKIHMVFPRLRLEIQIEDNVKNNTTSPRGRVSSANVKSDQPMIPRSIHSDT
ncbi:RYAR-like protein [Mya arenaria]|uniref:RYAR-like protein n=1 Tax=Mya arenaria TaxID=6604 RepID=A0ABY7DFD6_MYAAR|nr:RYAR-like protein [Mya arenaria]